MPDAIPEGGYAVQWLGSRSVPVEAAGDEIAISALGRRWRFRPEARPLLELLISGGVRSGAELESVEGDRLNPSEIRIFLRELAESGLIVIR
jgi:hypothetical protein